MWKKLKISATTIPKTVLLGTGLTCGNFSKIKSCTVRIKPYRPLLAKSPVSTRLAVYDGLVSSYCAADQSWSKSSSVTVMRCAVLLPSFFCVLLLRVITNKRIDLCLRPPFLVLRASTRSRLLSSMIMDAPVGLCVAALMMRHHSDDVYNDVAANRCAQLCCGPRGVAAKF